MRIDTPFGPMESGEEVWQDLLRRGIAGMLKHRTGLLDLAHIEKTPERVEKMYHEIFAGTRVEPASVLTSVFPSSSDEMVSLYDIDFVSHCAHHLLPFYGQAHFAYIPQGQLIGISKIPRLIGVLSARPQVQEELCSQIADAFQQAVEPMGCAVCLDAVHTCMFTRGVRKLAITRTTSLRGVFLDKGHAKEEFMAGIRRREK